MRIKMKLLITEQLFDAIEKVKNINVEKYEKLDSKNFLSITSKVKNLEYYLDKEYSEWISKQLNTKWKDIK